MKFIRTAFFLMVIAILAASVSCSGGDSSSSAAQKTPDEQVVNLNGYTFVIADFATNRWTPEPGTPRNDKVISIMDEVQSTYNCKIEFKTVKPETFNETLQPEVLAGGKFADIVMTTTWGYGRILGGNLMMDLKEIETLNLDSPWWNKNIQSATTIGGKVYANAGPFASHMYHTWCVYFNKKMWKDLNLEDPYQLVREGKWTYKKMEEFCQKALLDNDGNGKVDSNDDRWGVCSPHGDFCRAMYLGMEGRYFLPDDKGIVQLACDSERTYNVVEFMRNFVKKSNVLYSGSIISEEMFSAGKTLFFAYMPGFAYMRNVKDDFGVLPIPKWDEAQKNYIGYVDHNAPIFGVTSTNTNLNETGTVLEALGRRFQDVEKLISEDLEDTFWRSEDDIEMMDKYIKSSGGYDLGVIIQNANDILSTPGKAVWECSFGSSSDFSSMAESIKPAVDESLKEFFGQK